ncbi:MAG: hypothetical protein GOP50_12105 [Candidatus Heimdallarchaeota archaeon]|nr:hypothetical protein [Candidatus Heimdallarchaeota archaeon]
MNTEVLLKIDDEEVPLNNFLTKIFTNINWGIVETLKGIDLENIHTIQIKIEKTE